MRGNSEEKDASLCENPLSIRMRIELDSATTSKITFGIFLTIAGAHLLSFSKDVLGGNLKKKKEMI